MKISHLISIFLLVIISCKQELKESTLSTDNELKFITKVELNKTQGKIEINSGGKKVVFNENELPLKTAMVIPTSAIAYMDQLNLTEKITGISQPGEARWGHAQEKSIYDPCPEGWRVPDIMGAYENGKGSTPWFNGKKLSSNQGSPQPIGSHYGGQFVSQNNKAVGWFFNDNNYKIGHFPTTGIIGRFSPSVIGGTNLSQAVTGVWTASLTQQMKGFALAMTIGKLTDQNHRMISTGNISPAHGLNVRCAKDERRYMGDLGEDYFDMDVRDFSNAQQLSDLKIYPNPVVSDLNISIDKNYELSIFDLTGRIVIKKTFEQKKANLSDLPKGVYIALITDPKSKETSTYKIVKN